MPRATQGARPDPKAVYVAWKSFACAEFDGVTRRGDRLRGDHPAVVNHVEFFQPAATLTDEMPSELIYEREPEPEWGRVLLRAADDPHNVLVVEGRERFPSEEFETEGLVAKRLVEVGAAELVRKLRPKKKGNPLRPEREAPIGLSSKDLR